MYLFWLVPEMWLCYHLSVLSFVSWRLKQSVTRDNYVIPTYCPKLLGLANVYPDFYQHFNAPRRADWGDYAGLYVCRLLMS